MPKSTTKKAAKKAAKKAVKKKVFKAPSIPNAKLEQRIIELENQLKDRRLHFKLGAIDLD